MKKNIVFFLLLCQTIIAYPSTMSTPSFSVNLPQKMDKVFEDNFDGEPSISQYLYRSLPSSKTSPLQARFVVIGNAPKSEDEAPEYRQLTGSLMLSTFFSLYHIDTKSFSESTLKVLSTPFSSREVDGVTLEEKRLEIGDISALLTFAIVNHKTLLIFLISIAKDPETRNQHLSALIESLKSLKIH